MKLDYLLQRQKHLDEFIIASKGLENFDPKARLNNTALAMMVEVGELMNEVRSFKHWSKKPSSDKEVVIGEYVDVLHFFLSLANQLGFTADDIEHAYNKKNSINYERQTNGY